jgi:Mg2+-importing ATPase
MITFGVVSSLFDYLTFAGLLFLLRANVEQFRTGWFLESVVSASVIVLIIRTRQSFIQSKPSLPLGLATLGVVLATLALPYTGLGRVFGFTAMPPSFLLVLVGILCLYIVTAEAVKREFYKKVRL